MAFPPQKNDSKSGPPQKGPPPAPPASDSDTKHNDAHDSGPTPGFAANGHHTASKQAEHQAALNQDHGAGNGCTPNTPPQGNGPDNDD